MKLRAFEGLMTKIDGPWWLDERPIPTEAWIVPIDGSVVVVVRGDLDVTSSDHVSSVLGDSARIAKDAVFVDLHEVTFMDARGLSALIAGLAEASRHGLRYALVAPSAPVTRLLRAARADLTFVVEDSIESALANLDVADDQAAAGPEPRESRRFIEEAAPWSA